jgi:hypothetical protein
VEHDAAGAKGFGRDDDPVHGFAAAGDDGVVTGGDEGGGAAKLGLEGGDASVEVGFVRGLADDENRAAEFLEKKESGFDGGVGRVGAGAVRADGGFKSTVGALMGEGDFDAAPSIVGRGEVISDDSGDDGAAAPALGAGFKPATVQVVGAGKALGVGFIARGDGGEAPGGQRAYVLPIVLSRGGAAPRRTARRISHRAERSPSYRVEPIETRIS